MTIRKFLLGADRKPSKVELLKKLLADRTRERDLARKTLDDVRALINGQKL